MVHQEPRLLSIMNAADCKTASQRIDTLIDRRALLQPQEIAIETYDASLSFKQLSTESSRLSRYLHSLGIGLDQRVGILMEACVSYSLSTLAVLKSGSAFVPLDPTHPKKRLHQLVKEIDPVIIISSTRHEKNARGLHGNVLVVDEECAPWKEISLEVQVTTEEFIASANDAAYIIFTSGSTGVPKGVVIEHGSFVTSAQTRGRLTGLTPRSRVLQYAAHTFDVSLDEIFTTLIHGGCVCIPNETDRLLLEPAINRLKVNHALLTPTSAKILQPDQVPSLKTLQLGGELLSDEVIKKWSNAVRLFNVYGPSEASVACIMIERTRKDQPGNVIGFPVGSICHIVDQDDHNQLLPPGEVGELVIGGRLLAREYWNDPVRTASSFIYAPPWASSLPGEQPTRFYKSGDLAEMDENGMTRIHGRKDNQIKVRGQRMNVEEIETLLLSTNLVWGVVVALPKKGPLADKLTAIVYNALNPLSSTNPPSLAYLLQFSQVSEMDEQLQTRLALELRNSLPSAMVPSKWIHTAYLPQTSSGKIDRKWVRNLVEEVDIPTFLSIFANNKNDIPDSGKLHNLHPLHPAYEKVLCRVLGLDPGYLKPHLSFIRNGGDSIAAIELCRLGKEAGIPFWLGDILSTHSLKEVFRISQSRVPKNIVSRDQSGIAFSLSPVQQFFFDVMGNKPYSFTQSLKIQLKMRIEPAELKLILNDLVSMHPMLRARFTYHAGIWLQSISQDVEDSYSFSCHLVNGSNSSSGFLVPPDISANSDKLFDARLWESGVEDQQLQLSAHHLVTDLVSWRIILHDLSKLLRREPLLGSSMSFQTWCSLQQDYTKTLNPQRLLHCPIAPDNCAYWHPPGASLQNKHSQTAKSSFYLEKGALESFTNPMSEIQPVEVMMGSFYTAFANVFTDRETPTIFVESHGREPWEPEIDISRTVGWFTTAYPIHVPAHQAIDLQSSVTTTMQARRSIPANGHPYWCHRFLGQKMPEKRKHSQAMEFVFNFAGEFQEASREDLPFRVLSTVGEETAHPEAQRLSIFDIFVSVEEGRLNFTITFPSNVAHVGRIEDLMFTWKSILKSTAPKRNVVNIASTSFDLSKDVPNLLPEGRSSLSNDVRNFYWVSDLQNHMLISSVSNPMFYRVVGTWRLRSLNQGYSIGITRLQDAWHQVVANHSILRTTFVYDQNKGRFLAVVVPTPLSAPSPSTSSSPHSLKWTAENGEAHHEASLFPHRLIVHETIDDTIQFSLEFNHAIVDATSRSILLEDLLDACTDQPLSAGSNDYQRYIQNRAHCHKWSSENLSKVILCIFAPDTSESDETLKTPLCSVDIPGPNCAYMGRICSRRGVTISSLIFTVWSLVLSKFVSKEVVSFAYVASGRSVEMSSKDRSVGLYVDLLILGVNVEAYESLWNLVLDVQQRATSSISNRNPPAFACKDPRNGRSNGQINTMVNIRNAGVDSLKLERNGHELSMERFEDPWDYDLALAVDIEPGSAINFSISHRISAISSNRAAEVAETLAKTLDLFLENDQLSRLVWKKKVGISVPLEEFGGQ